MKNYTPLAKITSRNVSVMIFRYKSWYKVNNTEFTLPKDLSLKDFFERIDFFANFDKTRYNLNNPQAMKTAKKCEKLKTPAKELFENFGLESISNLSLYRETLKII